MATVFKSTIIYCIFKLLYMRQDFLAFDLGASNGRLISGTLESGSLRIGEINRFPNRMLHINGNDFWNIYGLYERMIDSLKIAAGQGIRPESIAVDTWGVDFGLIDKSGRLLGLPYAYRDHRTDGVQEQFFRIISRERIYRLTGIAFWQFNSLYQLFAWKRDQPDVLGIASKVLFMPDIFNYLFSGALQTEFTFATTSQLYNPMKGAWEEELFRGLDIPLSLMGEIVPPGTLLGSLKHELAGATSLGAAKITAVASHDTGSAVACIPAEGDDWAFISSGTWSLMGIEIDRPVISNAAMEHNFTNEGGVGGTFRFLKNIMGLWLLQECNRNWSAAGKSYSHAEQAEMAGKARPFGIFIDPEWLGFLNPGNMPDAIRTYLERTGQPAEPGHGAIVRCILESLAMQYRKVLEELARITGKSFRKLHIIGGGTQNEVLCRFAASATALPVVSGPAEATAAGNIMVQAMASGCVRDLAGIRKVIRNSFDLKTYTPEETGLWEQAYSSFRQITAQDIKN